MTDVLLISESTLKKYTLINDNVSGEYIYPAIRMAQSVDLDTIIGTVLNEKIQNMVANGTITDSGNANYKKLLDEYITPYLCYQIMSSIQIMLNYKLTNSGVIENNDEKKSRISFAASKELQTQYERYASSFGKKLTNYLTKNVNLYPEYTKCENFQYAEDVELCDIYLGDIPTSRKNYIGK